MHITVNGRTLEIKSGLTLHELILFMGLDPSVVVAELNQDIVPGEKFPSTSLHPGDRLELLSFVGGG
jgi:sulfur carrier protein